MGRLSSGLRRQRLNLILAALLIGLVANGLLRSQGPRDLIGLAHERTRLQAANEQLRTENLHLTAKLSRLRTDSGYVERLIRRELGYTRPDEFVYYFRTSQAAGQ